MPLYSYPFHSKNNNYFYIPIWIYYKVSIIIIFTFQYGTTNNIINEGGGKMQVKRNIMINKAGGNSGANTKNYRVSLPADMIRDLGITEEDKGVILTCEYGKIIIEKNKEDKNKNEGNL